MFSSARRRLEVEEVECTWAAGLGRGQPGPRLEALNKAGARLSCARLCELGYVLSRLSQTSESQASSALRAMQNL